MHVLVDAVAVRPGSAAIGVQHMLAGWSALGTDDRFTVLVDREPSFRLPPGTQVVRIGSRLGQAWLRSVGVRRAARRLRADAVVSGVTASALLGARCPHGAIVYDLRHELRPEQFGRGRRLARRVSYAWSFRVADRLFCISARTRDDLVRGHPGTREKAVVARFGADHADAWPAPAPDRPRYALAFGQFANKNVDAVLDAWAALDDPDLPLRLVGMDEADRAAAGKRVASLGLADRVELMPWLDDEEFAACFVGAALVVFPSDFEGFGLPAAEALCLGIPLVVSADPALAEVTDGHAVVAADLAPGPLAEAVRAALARTPEQLAAGRERAATLTWARMAASVRSALLEVS